MDAYRNPYIVIVALAAMLQGCGGGGGETTTLAPGTTPVVVSPEAEVLAELNRMRASAGVPSVSQSPQATAAADSHAQYLVNFAVNGVSFHSEDPGKPGFTGASVGDRLSAAGYGLQAGTTEVVAVNVPTWDAMKLFRSLMNAPYHGLAMLTGTQDVGISSRLGSNGRWLVMDLTAKSGAYATVPAGEVRMWPCNGVGNILPQTIDTENPNPIAGRSLLANPIGTPIYLLVTEGKELTLTSYEVKNTVSGLASPVAKVLGQVASDGLPTNQRAILPDQPLAANTTYRVSVSGVNDGQSFSKACEFTTGSGT